MAEQDRTGEILALKGDGRAGGGSIGDGVDLPVTAQTCCMTDSTGSEQPCRLKKFNDKLNAVNLIIGCIDVKIGTNRRCK
jgi:hypothetical protein